MLQLDWLRFSLSIQQLFSVAVSLTGRRSCSCKTKTRISHSHFRHFFVFLSSHWLIMISCCHLIGCCDYMTLNRKALLELTSATCNIITKILNIGKDLQKWSVAVTFLPSDSWVRNLLSNFFNSKI